MAEDDRSHSAASHRGLITVFGGTGFLGRRIVRHLLDHGFEVRIASRHPGRLGSASRTAAGLETATVDVRDENAVAAALLGAYGAVNAVSLYVEHGGVTFDAVHVEAAARVARLARVSGVERLIHLSGIGADPDSSVPYIASRGRGEIAVRQGFPGAILIRPAVMFGPDDVFLVTVARLLRILPVYPMFGRGETKLQPVYVEDVAEGIARVLSGAGGSAASYEFAGARVYTYRELLRTIADRIGASPRLVPLPFALWRILALGAEFLPDSPLTRNQVELMQRENVPAVDCPSLRASISHRRKSTRLCLQSRTGAEDRGRRHHRRRCGQHE
jgi:NADH dehydrogenase